MSAVEKVPLSARVDPELRDRVLEAGGRAGDPDASTTIRRLLELGLEAQERAGKALEPAAGAHRKRGRDAQRNAAAATTPRTGTARHAALELIVNAGPAGMTADAVAAALEARYPLNTVARRVTDLLQAGLITEATCEQAEGSDRPYVVAGAWGARPCHADEVTFADGGVGRSTRTGTAATVYAVTTAGLAALALARREPAEGRIAA